MPPLIILYHIDGAPDWFRKSAGVDCLVSRLCLLFLYDVWSPICSIYDFSSIACIYSLTLGQVMPHDLILRTRRSNPIQRGHMLDPTMANARTIPHKRQCL